MDKQTVGKESVVLRNDFHATEARLMLAPDALPSGAQVKRVRLALCGQADCKCATSSLGTRGRQMPEARALLAAMGAALALTVGRSWRRVSMFGGRRHVKRLEARVNQLEAALSELGRIVEKAIGIQTAHGAGQTMPWQFLRDHLRMLHGGLDAQLAAGVNEAFAAGEEGEVGE